MVQVEKKRRGAMDKNEIFNAIVRGIDGAVSECKNELDARQCLPFITNRLLDEAIIRRVSCAVKSLIFEELLLWGAVSSIIDCTKADVTLSRIGSKEKKALVKAILDVVDSSNLNPETHQKFSGELHSAIRQLFQSLAIRPPLSQEECDALNLSR